MVAQTTITPRQSTVSQITPRQSTVSQSSGTFYNVQSFYNSALSYNATATNGSATPRTVSSATMKAR